MQLKFTTLRHECSKGGWQGSFKHNFLCHDKIDNVFPCLAFWIKSEVSLFWSVTYGLLPSTTAISYEFWRFDVYAMPSARSAFPFWFIRDFRYAEALIALLPLQEMMAVKNIGIYNNEMRARKSILMAHMGCEWIEHMLSWEQDERMYSYILLRSCLDFWADSPTSFYMHRN